MILNHFYFRKKERMLNLRLEPDRCVAYTKERRRSKVLKYLQLRLFSAQRRYKTSKDMKYSKMS